MSELTLRSPFKVSLWIRSGEWLARKGNECVSQDISRGGSFQSSHRGRSHGTIAKLRGESPNRIVWNCRFQEALAHYTRAIDLSGDAKDDKTLAVCLKNRAAVLLKEEDYEAVVTDCSRSLELVPNDPKALFRR